MLLRNVYLPLTNNGNVERCPMNVTDNTSSDY